MVGTSNHADESLFLLYYILGYLKICRVHCIKGYRESTFFGWWQCFLRFLSDVGSLLLIGCPPHDYVDSLRSNWLEDSTC